MDWDDETNTFIPKPEKQATSTPQNVEPEEKEPRMWPVVLIIVAIILGFKFWMMGRFE